MTKLVLAGTFLVTIVLNILLLISYFGLNHHYVGLRLIIGISVIAYLGLVLAFLRYNFIKLAAWMLIGLYTSIATFVLLIWGINAPIGILVLGFVIVLASVMRGAKSIIPVTILMIGILIILQVHTGMGLSSPDLSSFDNASSFGDVISYSMIFTVFALIAWLSRTQMEQALLRTLAAESALKKEKESLANKLEVQTQNLRESQLKEMKQLYKFAELGQLTTIILHELANYLSVLTLDIEDIKERHHNSIAIDRAKESIFYIDAIIDQVRNQIKESDSIEKFRVSNVVEETIHQLRKKLPHANIDLNNKLLHEKSPFIIGDPLRLSQAIIILVTNAAQATKPTSIPRIIISQSKVKSAVQISVRDYGVGIISNNRQNLFNPKKSEKIGGLGIGLYITKQIIETHFKGTIVLDPSFEYTQFTITLPVISTPRPS
ncbi:HAMP domain-containing histidine kinase [Candidatus Saccharibacteria bacterium]|nr:HAMP domain-containing histidine kinase [Candidatus Saccharibacteria bacterium]